MGTTFVVGAGGIGGVIGFALASAGVNVVVVEADRRKIDAGRTHGLTVSGFGSRPAAFRHFDDWNPASGDRVWLCTKCYDNAAVLDRLPDGVELVPVQNGFDPTLDARPHGFEGIASFVSKGEPDRPHCTITRPGELHVGRRTNRVCTGDPIAELAAAPRGLFRLVRVVKIEPFKHAKLMYNAAISPLAAAAGLDNGALLSLPPARRLFFALIAENYRILSAAGVELGKVGPFRPATVAAILRRKWLARLMAFGFEPSLRGTYCSMAGEIQKGRTELDNYTGHLLRLAHGKAPAPLNRAVFDLVSMMTAERSPPRPEVLAELAKHVEVPFADGREREPS